MFDEQHFTRDAETVRFHDDANGVTVDEDGGAEFDWDSVETVVVDNPPHANAFDSKEFYKIPATVARPIPQPYRYGNDTVWLKKPREELKKAAWSLDNRPWTLTHPDTGFVRDVDDVHGYWANPRYIDQADDLDADLHIPVNDEEAKEFVEENDGVSVGFSNRIVKVDDYDGVVGGSDDDSVEIEGYQTQMLFDHVASVAVGRCPTEKGCGLDSQQHGHVDSLDAESFKRGTRITDGSDDGTDHFSDMRATIDAPDGIYVTDGKWFAVGPDEHPDDTTDYAGDAKYPLNDCGDVQDAWNLRGGGDIDVEKSTLETRIKRAAEALDCSDQYRPWTDAYDGPEGRQAAADSAKHYSICGARKHLTIDRDVEMCGCGDVEDESDEDETDNTDMAIDFEFDDLSAEAAIAKLESNHDEAAEQLDELRQATDKAEAAEEAADELGIDEVSDLADAVSVREQRIEELEQKVDELQQPKVEEDAEFIAERTDRFGDDADDVIETVSDSLEDGEDLHEVMADKRELVEDLTEGYDEQTANSGGDDGGTKLETDATGYVKTPWE